MLALRPMSQDEFAAFYAFGVEDYAQERSRNFDTPLEDERAESARQFADLLKDGLQTAGQHLWKVVDDRGEAVGSLWVAVQAEQQRAFIFDIVMDEDQRGKGYGGQTLQLLEEELRPLGIQRIGLNVFADNPRAMHLYEKQGYRFTNHNMTKQI
ncbi:MAG TPA: GNAT family N-acetyltransferase [Chloroflexia bacterium]|nr:GNAT family N-acetyltransferase [Chloroflexia bacterium]